MSASLPSESSPWTNSAWCGPSISICALRASAVNRLGSSGKSANCACSPPLGTAVKARRLTPRSANAESTW